MICGMCGRRLKDSESIQRGYGPVCYRKIMPPAPRKIRKKVSSVSSFDDIPDYHIPGQMELSDFIKM